MRHAAIAIGLVILLALGALVPARAGMSVIADMPTAVLDAPVIQFGNGFYTFGGRTNAAADLDKVFYVDIATAQTTHVATLPWPRSHMSGATDGEYIYLFGGYCDPSKYRYVGCDFYKSATADILRFDPATNAIVTLPERLPTASYDSAAVWLGDSAYILGGTNGTPYAWGTKDIFRFQPGVGATKTPYTMPVPVSEGEAFVWNGRIRYVGGQNVFEVDVANGTSSIRPETTPHGIWRSAVGVYRDMAFLVGGASESDHIVVYNLTSNAIWTLNTRVPTFPGVAKHGGGWTDRGMMIIGGVNGGYVKKVQLFTPEPSDIYGIRVTRGVASLWLNWTAGGLGLSAMPYELYLERSSSSGGPFERIAQLSSTDTSYADLGLPHDTEFFYRFIATNAWGPGAYSVVVGNRTASVPSAPQNVVASGYVPLDGSTGPRDEPVRVTWRPPASNGGAPVVSYQVWASALKTPVGGIRVDETRTFIVPASVCIGTTCRVDDPGCTNLQVCIYTVSAINEVGRSNSGSGSCVTLDRLAPGSVGVPAVGGTCTPVAENMAVGRPVVPTPPN